MRITNNGIDVKRLISWFSCKIGLHYNQSFVENITGDTGLTLTIGFHQCERCGHSKIDFIYGS